MNQEHTNIFDTSFSDLSKNYLLETARWTKFLAVMMFIFTGIMLIGVVAVLASGQALSGMATGFAPSSPAFTITIFLFIILLYWYPSFMLYKFSTSIKSGLTNNNQELIDKAFRCQKNMYKFMGISIIALLVFYVLVIVFAIVAAI